LRFLDDTLALWGVTGTAQSAESPLVASIPAADGSTISIGPATEGPFRWLVHVPGRRPRPCASLVGVLSALRGALGVERGNAVRVVPPSTPLRYAQDERDSSFVRAERSETQSKPEQPQAIPVTVITGFLGSGKTTLLGRLLRDPAMGRAAVIINEFGEIPLDHELIETGDESFVQLSNGCLCCKVRSDLTLTLSDLASRRAAGTVPPFERAVIETSGLADPAPILHALMTDDGLSGVYALDRVVTTVDALTGLSTLDAHPESLRQAAVADRIVLTKTDVPGADPRALAQRIGAINPEAPVLTATYGDIAASALFDGDTRAPSLRAHSHAGEHEHSAGITSFTLTRDQPVHGVALALFLSALAENCGADLLRVKGLVQVTEEPSRPAVIHGVQHVYHAPVWLDGWPSNDRRTRIVFIGRNVRRPWVQALLELLEAEVGEEDRRYPGEGRDPAPV